MGKQTDLILLDFSKAFDKDAHEKLLLKLHHYGIRGDTLKWIKDFLDNQKQAVVINGINLALPANIPTLPTLAQFSSAICRVIHVSPWIPASVLFFTYTNTPSCTVQTHLTTFSIYLFQLTPQHLVFRNTRPTFPSGVKTYWKIDR